MYTWQDVCLSILPEPAPTIRYSDIKGKPSNHVPLTVYLLLMTTNLFERFVRFVMSQHKLQNQDVIVHIFCTSL